METFKAFLDYFTLPQWIAIGIVCRGLFWLTEKITDRHLERMARNQRLKSGSQSHCSHPSRPDNSPPE